MTKIEKTKKQKSSSKNRTQHILSFAQEANSEGAIESVLSGLNLQKM